MCLSAAKILLISWALPLCLVIGAAQAEAQTCRSDGPCSALLDSGLEAFKVPNYERALTSFEAAYALLPDPVLLLNIGRAHYRLGHPDKAVEYYLRFQGAVPNPNPEIAGTFEKYLSEARKAQAQANAARDSNLKKPVYKKWWFWTLIAAGVAATATAVGLEVKAATSPPQMLLDREHTLYITF